MGLRGHLANIHQLVLNAAPDEIVNGPPHMQIIDIDGAGLSNAMSTVLGLHNVPRSPSQLSEHHNGSCLRKFDNAQ